MSNHISRVLVSPIVTEKAAMAEQNNVVAFWVHVDATKELIAQAVAKYFNVVVERVTTVSVKGKRVQFRQQEGRRSKRKKAYVRLAEGQVIHFEESVKV